MKIINIKGYGDIDLDKYTSLKECMLSTIDSHDENGNDIMSDSDWEFADMELSEYWYEYKGFTREDIEYIHARGLDDMWSELDETESEVVA